MCLVASFEFFLFSGPHHSFPSPVPSLAGHVNSPKVVEEEMSIDLRELLERHCGGVRGGWSNLQAIIPGGSSVPVMDEADCQSVSDLFFVMVPRAWLLVCGS